jgi:hypothetical protein
MKRLSAIAVGVVAGLLVASSAIAAGPPPSGTTELLAAPQSGTTMMVRVTVHSVSPVVPAEYAIQNECQLPDKTRTYQRDDIITWTDTSASGDPQTDMPVYLQSVPAGASCKVFLARNNNVVKGSTTTYKVTA